jgi:hypothetical protein
MILMLINTVEFYAELGSKRLSGLVREEYRTGQELREHRNAGEVRGLVLQRLPLFLHDHHHDRPQVSLQWMNTDGHFLVRSFNRVSVDKTLRFNNILVKKTSDASAVAKQEGNMLLGRGTVQLWISAHTQVDMFE